MNYLLIIGALLAATGCASYEHVAKWDVPGTGPIVCKTLKHGVCGLSLGKCGDSETVELPCLKEATYLGPGAYLNPVIVEEPKVPADYAPGVDGE